MIRLAILDVELAAAILTSQTSFAPESRELDVVWSGGNVKELLAHRFEDAPDVVVLDMALLGPDAPALVQTIRARISARTVITSYAFARRDDIERLRRAGSDVVLQGPLSVRTLRTFLLSMLLERKHNAAPAPITTPPPGPSAEASPVTPPRFSKAVLLALRDLATPLQCECPNHLSELVQRLLAFEAYSKDCENKNDADARMHRTLWFATARARRILEDALVELVAHEKIIIDGDTVKAPPR